MLYAMTNVQSGDQTSNSSIRDFLIGAAAGGLTEALFYALDSAKVRIQLGTAKAANERISLLRGLFPSVMIGSVPSFGCFFVCYVPLKRVLETTICPQSLPFTHVLVASSIAAVPSSLVAVPSDVIKKTIFSKSSHSYVSAFYSVAGHRGLKGLFSGWQANLARDVPFVAIKMSLYEGLVRQYNASKAMEHTGGLSSVESASIGFVSGLLTAVLTNPTDCVNTRIKTGELAHLNLLTAHMKIVQLDGVAGLLRGIGPRVLITVFGSTVFWFIHSQLQ